MLLGVEVLTQLLLVNAALQITLFLLVACIPFLKTGRMPYVDIAWPNCSCAYRCANLATERW